MSRQCQGKASAFAGLCERTPTVIRDGKWYCWQHDPVRLQRQAKTRWERRKAEIAKTEAEHEARIERRQLERDAGVTGLTNDDLRELIRRGGIRALLAGGD